MKRTIINKIKLFLNKIDCIENINLDLCTIQKKCLVSYFTLSFNSDISNSSIHASNVLELNQIIKTFIDLNYCIDVVFSLDMNAYDKIKTKNYDLIFGFGEVFNRMVKDNPESKKIMYLTEHDPKFSLVKETERIEYYYTRHKKKVKLNRSGKYYQEDNFKYIDDLIVLGETFPFDEEKFNVHSIKPSGMLNKNYILKKRNLDSSKNNFLWFGSNGAIHKGLDLLLDIFKKRDDIYLHVCGLNNKDRSILKIPKRPNIFDYGRIDVNGDLYLNLVNISSFVLLPSCSEASSTAVLTCMRHSMIPIIMEKTGFDYLKNLVFLLNDYKLDYLESSIDLYRSYSNTEIDYLHTKIFDYANENFSLEKYNRNFKMLMNNILIGYSKID